jgi:hypothetical protein
LIAMFLRVPIVFKEESRQKTLLDGIPVMPV